MSQCLKKKLILVLRNLQWDVRTDDVEMLAVS